ncbi:hypothetical protein HYW35_02795 [Candidatus Saccharibacteria bacterium]|nr:hypothetical protein [Candidatus Saccharibacteria bacterium]
MEPDNSAPKATVPPTPSPEPGPASAPPQQGVKAEIVENIPVEQPATESMVAADQSQPAAQPQPKPLTKKIGGSLKPAQKTPPSLRPAKTATKSSPLLVITTASLVAVALAVAAFFAFSAS